MRDFLEGAIKREGNGNKSESWKRDLEEQPAKETEEEQTVSKKKIQQSTIHKKNYDNVFFFFQKIRLVNLDRMNLVIG